MDHSKHGQQSSETSSHPQQTSKPLPSHPTPSGETPANQSKNYPIKGMHCASCANTIEKTLKKEPGVNSCSVNYGTETADLSFDPQKTNLAKLSAKVEPLGYSIAQPTENHINHGMPSSEHEKMQYLQTLKNKVITSIPLIIISAFVMGWDILGIYQAQLAMPLIIAEFFHHLLPLFATYSLFYIGQPYLLGLYRFFRYGKANMDSLVGLGTAAAFLYSFMVSAFEETLPQFFGNQSTYYDVTIIIIGFITLGKYLEEKSKLKTGEAIKKLMTLQAKTALVIQDGQEVELSTDLIKVGDLIRIKPGMRIPVDGIITEGSSNLDESMITGEPLPVQKKAGDSVTSGTINQQGSFIFKATKVGSDTLLSQIIKMVESAQNSRAPIQALADQISAIFVPAVLVIAVLSFALWLILGTGPLGFTVAFSYGLTCFIAVLIIACPCALGLATPTAIIVGVGKGAENGILIKNASSLQKLHNVNCLMLDKTGTITNGKPELTDLDILGKISEKEVLTILASLESNSEHPLAHAIVVSAQQKKITLEKVKQFHNHQGMGIAGEIGEKKYYAGNLKLLEKFLPRDHQNPQGARDKNPKLEEHLNRFAKQGYTPILLFSDQELLAIAAIGDTIKPQSIQAVKDLHRLGIKLIMLTGDHPVTAEFIAKSVGIDEVHASLLPQDKLTQIKEEQASGLIVAMVGDGINDSPALAQADVGIAVSTGTDIAIDTADITLLHGDISKLTQAIKLSKNTLATIKQNLFWAFIYNIIGIPLAAGLFYPLSGWLLNPVFAGLAMGLSSVSVVSNSLRLKLKKI